ncbi:HAD family hydrolase [Thalassobacillus sp. CUG 92003]|uniref:HAD family hydrolase n=1 Tax=Thalassobacillus sp. CUG 92003 TaxID=2736641 RepID=UPI0015E69678|nr:HAD family hydrolase [Thalassobacillus sp. CUG 92003]
MLKLFVSDLDGTLLGMNQYINDDDITALQSLATDGVELAIATGRMDLEIVEILKRFNHPAHRISQNGAFVYDQSDQHIHSKTFDSHLARKVMEGIAQQPMVKTVSTATGTYTEEHNKWVDLISSQMVHDITVDADLITQFGQTINPSKISLFGKAADVKNAYESVATQFEGELDSFISHETCVDLMPKNINKGNGLRALLVNAGFASEEIACVGDSFNDISMFELTPNSYAMSTAPEEVKVKANHVVDHVHEAIADLRKKEIIA